MVHLRIKVVTTGIEWHIRSAYHAIATSNYFVFAINEWVLVYVNSVAQVISLFTSLLAKREFPFGLKLDIYFSLSDTWIATKIYSLQCHPVWVWVGWLAPEDICLVLSCFLQGKPQ